MNDWIKIETKQPPAEVNIEVKVKHCNPRLNLKEQILEGKLGDDGFYLHDGGELSWNWDIYEWRIKNA